MEISARRCGNSARTTHAATAHTALSSLPVSLHVNAADLLAAHKNALLGARIEHRHDKKVEKSFDSWTLDFARDQETRSSRLRGQRSGERCPESWHHRRRVGLQVVDKQVDPRMRAATLFNFLTSL
ncbi:hypothetical protein J6590_014568 [Homalodisca vitripennis]|nr:hypothetical protein J6590_014568 [Homalodisca vitripennis]